MEEIPRERAISSEPRRNPFEDNDQSSRKRQRISHEESPSRSVDTARDSDTTTDPMLLEGGDDEPDADLPPSTPTQVRSQLSTPEPTSSRVTINLRTTRHLEPILSSPSPETPSKMVDGGADAITRNSIESESDALSTVPAIETPSSSPSVIESPRVEVVTLDDDDSDFADREPQVAILDDDSIFRDPLAHFPYWSDGETLANAVSRVARFLQYESIDNDESFAKIRDWIRSYMLACHSMDTFYETFSRNREFWTTFPELIWALNYRSRFFGDFLKRSHDGRQALTDMLCEFARLAGRFVLMDVKLLTKVDQLKNDRDPDLGSRPFLSAFSFLLRRDEGSHIGRNLETHYQWNWEDDSDKLSEFFQTEGGTIPNLTRLIECQERSIPRNPKVVESFTDPCRIVCKIVEDVTHDLQHPQGGLRAEQNLAVAAAQQQKITQGHKFFRVMSSSLEIVIEKHVTVLAPEAAASHLACLTSILNDCVLVENDAVCNMLEKYRIDNPTMPRKHFPKIISMEWKFMVLKKLITSSQMQLRVVGVSTMCTDLLDLFQKNKTAPDPSQSPILLFFANFVIKNQLVDYLVGIGSHPEIINESNNILGFLIVTKTYDYRQTDKIWQTVTKSQDPRVVEAILRMIMRCLNLYDYRALIYLCEKALDLPIESFTLVMRDFCHELFKQLLVKASSEGHCVDGPPYFLCARLIHDSSIISGDSTGLPDIQNFATLKFKELLIQGPPDEVRTEIFDGCLVNIAEKSQTAPGSICIINALVRQDISNLRELTSEHALTKLLVEQLEFTVKDEHQSPQQATRNTPVNLARRELLLAIILHDPASINSDLGQRLWNVLVGCDSRTIPERTQAWQILNTAVKKAPDNLFIASCFKDHLPHLPPHCFTPGTLEFAKESVISWLRSIGLGSSGEDQSFGSPALEQIWRMILTAPQNSIDAPAITFLVGVYTDSDRILAMPRSKARIIHLALVDRCLDQLKGAAAKLKEFAADGSSSGSEEGMVIIPSDEQFREQEKTFARSLAVLREFLRAYHTKPQFAPLKPKPQILPATDTIEGDPLTIKYQAFDDNKQTDIQTLTLGTMNTAGSLFAFLAHATGFRKFSLYCGGRVIKFDEIDLSAPWEDLKINALILVKRENEDAEGFNNDNNTTLEVEITKHFDELWSYLGMHEKVAQEIYLFLVKFPVYEHLLEIFDSDTPYSEIFPIAQPYKSLYAVHSLREYILGLSQKTGTVDEKALLRAISLVVAAISDRNVLDQCTSDDLRDFLAMHLVESLVLFLKEPLLPSAVAAQLDTILLERLLQLLYTAKGVETSQNSGNLTSKTFETILEACSHSASFWGAFTGHLNTSTLLKDLLLEDPRPLVRKNVAKQIVQKCIFSPSLSQVSTMSFVKGFWPMIARLLMEAVLQPHQCEETFYVAENLFKRLAETSLEALDLESLVREWGNMLLVHTCIESIGNPDSVDLVVKGLGSLLHCATTFAKASQKSLSCSKLGLLLFQKLLFPELSIVDEDTTDIIVAKVPLLHPWSRSILSEAIFQLIKDDQIQYKAMLAGLSALVPHVHNDEIPYVYDLSFQFERNKSIRSHTGYVGLKNLSNTCYLNSLFTQLFMNVAFRDFMLNAHVADANSQQKLLSETQYLFSYMQNSFRRFVDPFSLAGSIRTYEETAIDVTIQMDVDEFYNLLFDRWESQILAPDAKRKFRSFYGGQLVQQVKSKECPHVSERLEPFSAIQCDIKGKSCLQESLQAYVDGEVMEGDNKYKCSTCDRHVDAVKRACLKDIPDNLIFHLKRFDFNLRTLMRSKINDHFSFPTKIDMRPYKVEHLMDSPEETPEDVFELVGILVHSGTAESGHYYSYIRERPSTADKESWVEFNDDNVSVWDPSQMESNCFGGLDYRGTLDGAPYDKVWSAYMLFYQRSSVLAAQRKTLQQSGATSPVRLPVPPRLSNHIAMENELLMRKYCLYDPSHSAFVAKMLSNMKHLNGGQCSQPHSLEREALTCSLNHLDQVVARTKDIPDFPTFIMAIRQICHACAECSRDYLEWYCDCPEALRQLLLRNPDAGLRTEIGKSILDALKKVKADAPYAYGLGDDEDSTDELDGGDPQLIQRVVRALLKLWEIFHNNCRAWPEYFGLLSSIASLGNHEAAVLLDAGYLRKTLEIVSADGLLPLGMQYTKMLNIISKRINTRPVSFEAVIELLAKLLRACGDVVESIEDEEDRLDFAMNEKEIPLTVTERHLLMQHWTRSQSHILTEKLLIINQNWEATQTILIELMNWPESLDTYISQAIINGIRRSGNSPPAGPFLQAALLYAKNSGSSTALPNMVVHVAKAAHRLDIADGKEFLHFFKQAHSIAPKLPGVDQTEFQRIYLEQVFLWAPGLLTNYDSEVRGNTEEFLLELILQSGPEVSADVDEMEKSSWLNLAAQKLGIACLEFLNENYVRPRQQVVRQLTVNIHSVIERCTNFFPDGSQDSLTLQFTDLMRSILPAIKKYEVEEADEEVSDWDGSEGEYDGSSEPMDSIADLCSAVDDDAPL